MAEVFVDAGMEGTSGIITVRTEGWNSFEGPTNRREKTLTWGGDKGEGRRRRCQGTRAKHDGSRGGLWEGGGGALWVRFCVFSLL